MKTMKPSERVDEDLKRFTEDTLKEKVLDDGFDRVGLVFKKDGGVIHTAWMEWFEGLNK